MTAMPSLRVLYLTLNPNRTSTLRPVEGWFGALRPRGLQPVMAFDRLGTFHEWAVAEQIPSYHVPLPHPNKWNPWPLFRSLWRLRRLVRRHQVQLIHCNEHDVYPIGQYLARICRLPVVVSVHCGMQRGYAAWAFRGRRSPRHVFLVSQSNARLCGPALAGIVPDERRSVLYNGLDLDAYRPDRVLAEEFRREHKLTGYRLVGNACIISPVKQLEHLLEAGAQITQPDVRVVLAGGPLRGHEDYAGALLAQARRMLGERFVHVGRLPDVRGFFNALDVLVNTSAGEACSISILEALACGCPVLGYPSNSVSEQVLPGAGEVVEQNDVSALVAGLQRWLAGGGELQTRRTSARRRAEQAFDVRRIADQLWTTYLDVLVVTPPTVSAGFGEGVRC